MEYVIQFAQLGKKKLIFIKISDIDLKTTITLTWFFLYNLCQASSKMAAGRANLSRVNSLLLIKIIKTDSTRIKIQVIN
jgi:hypothetical protein